MVDGPLYEFFDHTADIGIRARGATLAELFEQLARGLTALIAEDSVLQPREARAIRLSADDAESLLLAWLQELLFWFSAGRFLAADYVLEEVTPTSLRGTVRGERFDPARHVQGRGGEGETPPPAAGRGGDGAGGGGGDR